MSIATITAAQRVEARDAALAAALVMQRFTQSATTPRADETAEATPVLEAAAAALVVAGASGLPATSAVVANGTTINVENSAGNLDSPATATVAASAVTNVRLASTKTIVDNAGTIPVKHFDGTVVASSGVTAEVTAGVLVAARLPTGRALVTTAVKVPVGTVSGSGTFGTFTITNGVITGIVLSAS